LAGEITRHTFMFLLHLTCDTSESDLLSSQLWEAGTVGIEEKDLSDGCLLIACFETNAQRSDLVDQFAAHNPHWSHADSTDWIEATQRAWPPREIGQRLFLAPPWCSEVTPPGRLRIIHNPGLACGTGEHPCTQLALTALETVQVSGKPVADIGTGSGLLAIAALHLGAALAIGLDPDEAALTAARENFALNNFHPVLAAGFADSLRDSCSSVTVANISGTVLLSIADDLLRITSPRGQLILTGFAQYELASIEDIFGQGEVTSSGGWSCLHVQLS